MRKNERSVDADSLGGRMRAARKQRGKSLQEMAAEIEKNIGYLSKAETNGLRIPSSLVRLYESTLGLTIAHPGELPVEQVVEQDEVQEGVSVRTRVSPGATGEIVIHIDIHLHLEGLREKE